MRFVNDDVKIKHGGRKAVCIDMDELKRLIVAKAARMDIEYDDEEDEEYNLFQCVSTLITCDETLGKDNKFNADAENIMFGLDENYEQQSCDVGEHMLGFHTIENGLTFLGFIIGGDWEFGSFALLYYDGKKLRMYHPTYGNPVNLDCKCQFGSEESWSQLDDEKLKAKYQKLGVWDDDTTWSDMYVRKYGFSHLDFENIGYNWNAIKEDIVARIEIQNIASTKVTTTANTKAEEMMDALKNAVVKTNDPDAEVRFITSDGNSAGVAFENDGTFKYLQIYLLEEHQLPKPLRRYMDDEDLCRRVPVGKFLECFKDKVEKFEIRADD